MNKENNKQHIWDEAPSVALLVVCYLLFVGITIHAAQIGVLIAISLLIPVLVLHSSLQHEFIHGHPTQSQFINDLLVSLPIGLLVPYLRFKDTHLAHHFDPNLTDPYDDPESNYMDPEMWQLKPKWAKIICNFNNTLLGRMLVGPFLGLCTFYYSDALVMTKRNMRIIMSYIHHMIGLLVIAFWMNEFATLPLWGYLVASYFAMSILKIRTFLEHKAHERAAQRTVIIEDRGPLALLFLNNNFHAVHHCDPKLVWHKLPARYQARKNTYLKRNGHYQFSSYWTVCKAYFFKRKDPVPHPLMSGSASEQDRLFVHDFEHLHADSHKEKQH